MSEATAPRGLAEPWQQPGIAADRSLGRELRRTYAHSPVPLQSTKASALSRPQLSDADNALDLLESRMRPHPVWRTAPFWAALGLATAGIVTGILLWKPAQPVISEAPPQAISVANLTVTTNEKAALLQARWDGPEVMYALWWLTPERPPADMAKYARIDTESHIAYLPQSETGDNGCLLVIGYEAGDSIPSIPQNPDALGSAGVAHCTGEATYPGVRTS